MVNETNLKTLFAGDTLEMYLYARTYAIPVSVFASKADLRITRWTSSNRLLHGSVCQCAVGRGKFFPISSVFYNPYLRCSFVTFNSLFIVDYRAFVRTGVDTMS